MNKRNSIQTLLAGTDIYLIDQIMKGRYREHDKILDAGCGTGRNMQWFLQNNFDIYGIDIDNKAIKEFKKANPGLSDNRLQVSSVEKMPFSDNYFDHIISSAVLHFAENTAQYTEMLAGMIRVLKPGGSLFIRMTSDIGIEDKIKLIADGVYHIPDGSNRFLLTRSLLTETMQQHGLTFIEPLKTVNVDDTRCMSTLLLQKN